MFEMFNDFFFGKVFIVLIVGLGVYFMICLCFVQFCYFGYMFGVFRELLCGQVGQFSFFQVLMLSFVGWVGVGNIVGVGIVVIFGGLGVVFWMWVIVLVGMFSSFFECILVQVYKCSDGDGLYCGGLFYYIQYGLKLCLMVVVFVVFLLVIYGFVFNGLQFYIVIYLLQNVFGFVLQYIGIVLVVLFGVVFIGGIKCIVVVFDLLVLIKILVYIGVILYVIVSQIEYVLVMLEIIVKSVFGLDLVFGGLFGSVIVMGVKCGVFVNEVGLGSVLNVVVVVVVCYLVVQGVVQVFSVFFDIFVICICIVLLILFLGFYILGFEGDGIVFIQNFLVVVVGDWGWVFVSVVLLLFVFICIFYNFYLGENSLQFFSCNCLVLIGYCVLVLVLVVWGLVQDLFIVFVFVDIIMICLVFVNLMVLVLLFKVGLWVMCDYDVQCCVGIKQLVFDLVQFVDFDLDCEVWFVGQCVEFLVQVDVELLLSGNC